MEELEKNIQYLEAKRRVKQIKKFYIHLAIYLGFNLISFLSDWNEKGGNFRVYDGLNISFTYLWGIIVIMHGISVFLPAIRNWERNKIMEIMDRSNKIKNEQ